MDNHSADTGFPCVVDWKSQVLAGPKPWKKPTTNQHVLYVRSLDFFCFKSKVVLKNPTLNVDFSGKSRKKHTNSMDPFGVLGKSNSLQGADFQTLFTRLPKSERKTTCQVVFCIFFWRLYKNPLGNLSNNFQ